MRGYSYPLVGGDPALNFLNTIHDWTETERRDHLTSYAGALRFGEAAGLLSPADVRRLHGAAPAEMRRLRDLRSRLERVFRAVVESRSPSRPDLDALARDAAAAAAMTTITRSNSRYTRAIDPARAGHATLRLRIVDAAIALLTAPPDTLHRIKACPACGWFFRDDTRSATRKWCSMATCGSLAKSRSYYWRTKRDSSGRRASLRSVGPVGPRYAR
jgi:predicted RNA-binding Zn ribbon-like protein